MYICIVLATGDLGIIKDVWGDIHLRGLCILNEPDIHLYIRRYVVGLGHIVPFHGLLEGCISGGSNNRMWTHFWDPLECETGCPGKNVIRSTYYLAELGRRRVS